MGGAYFQEGLFLEGLMIGNFYPDLNYLDFSIIQTCFSGPVFQ